VHRRLSAPWHPANLVTWQRCRYCSGRTTTGPTGHPVVARLAAELAVELGDLTEQLVVMSRQADESYLAVGIDDLRCAVGANLASFVGDLASQQSPSTSSSRDTARRRAGQDVPLGSVLHAYRLGFHVVWGALADRALRKGPYWLDGLVRGSATVWAWVDTSSEAVNAEYRDALIESAREDEQRRMLLLDTLFEGRPGEWKMLGGSMPAIGLPERARYLAVSAETPGTGIENLPAPGQFLRRSGVPSTWRLRADEQVGVIAVSQDRTAPAVRNLLGQVATGRVGISPEYDDALDTGRALGIAAVARRCLPPGSIGVATIDDSVAALVAGTPEISGRVVHRLLGRVANLAREEQEILLTTLGIWLECGGNASAAARELYCHRNTVRNRLHRLEALSGQSLSDPHGVAGLSIAAQGVRLLGPDLTIRPESMDGCAPPA
jgi:PucR C-terminal helix-turn-helix domain